tara:strand:+ start:436 stop:555 length:120 start_codon:yes stop_codon:yes gene_type:complete
MAAPSQRRRTFRTHCRPEMKVRLEFGVGITYGPNAAKAD